MVFIKLALLLSLLLLFDFSPSKVLSDDTILLPVETIKLGNLLDTLTSPEGYMAGSGLFWGMTLDEYIQTMQHPEQLQPNHPKYNPIETQVNFIDGRCSITPYEQFEFSDISLKFQVTYSFDENHKLYAVLYRAGSVDLNKPVSDIDAAWMTLYSGVVDILEKLCAYAGESRTMDELQEELKESHALHLGTRTIWEGKNGTFASVTTERLYPGITMIIGLQSHIIPSPGLPKFGPRE